MLAGAAAAKYKKCHSAFDERLERLWEEGWEVLPRTLYKTPADIEGIKRSAAINVGVLDYVGEHIAAGMTTNQIDQMIYDYTVEHGGTPADLNYEGYPKSVCTSINDVVCHGIPCDTDVLHEGDIINVDCSTIRTVTLVIRAVCSASARSRPSASAWSTSPAPAWRLALPPSSRGCRCP